MEPVNILTTAGLVGVLIWNAYQFIDKKKRLRDVDYEKAGTGLIKLLQDTKIELLNENQQLRNEVQVLRTEVASIKHDYNLLHQIFQGRDEDAINFRVKGLEAFEIVKSTNDILVSTHANSMKIDNDIKQIRKKLDA